jgi:hypothetical protein
MVAVHSSILARDVVSIDTKSRMKSAGFVFRGIEKPKPVK